MNKLTNTKIEELLDKIEKRFNANMHRHANISWQDIKSSIEKDQTKLAALMWMEETKGEPDVLCLSGNITDSMFVDFSKESPSERKSLCYDDEALNSRKEHKPKGSAMRVASENNVELLDEDTYKQLQSVEDVDLKTSSWLLTPSEIRKLGGAIYGDKRFNRTFIYHNGAESYYSARGFRVKLKI